MTSIEVIPLAHEVSAGETFEVAIIFSMEPEWHTYWQNPGEAGMPSTFEWSLPENFTIINRQEPTPTRHVDEGITTFIHEEQAIYLFSIQAPNEVADSNTFAVDIQWLECKSFCLSGSSQHQFLLTKGASHPSINQEWAALKERAEGRFPQANPELGGRPVHKMDQIELHLKSSAWDHKLLEANFFPFDEMIYDSGKPLGVKRGLWNDKIIIPLLKDRVIQPQALSGVLVQTHASNEGHVTTSIIINQPIQ